MLRVLAVLDIPNKMRLRFLVASMSGRTQTHITQEIKLPSLCGSLHQGKGTIKALYSLPVSRQRKDGTTTYIPRNAPISLSKRGSTGLYHRDRHVFLAGVDDV